MLSLKTLNIIFACCLLIFPEVFAQGQGVLNQSYGDKLIIGVFRDQPFLLNPFQIKSPQQKELIQLVFGYGLLKSPDKYGSPPPLISEYLAGPRSRKATTWRLLLERRVNFHNGGILRNIDVKFSLELVAKYGGFNLNRPFDLSNIKTIRGRGDLELIFELHEPDPDFPETISDIPIIPFSYYREAIDDGYEVFFEKLPVGMGPFKLDLMAENTWEFSHYSNYYSGRPFLDGVKVRFFDDQQQLVNALANDEVDFIELPDRDTAERLYDLMGSRIAVFKVPRTQVKVYSILLNLNSNPLNDSSVRLALDQAINREQMVREQLFDIGAPANTLIRPQNNYYDQSLYSGRYDPQKALQLLTARGWKINQQTLILEKNGKPLSIQLLFAENSSIEEEIVRSIKNDLADIHVDLQPRPLPPGDRLKRLELTRYDAMIYPYEYDPQFLFEAFEEFYFEILGAQRVPSNYTSRYLSQLFEIAYQRPEYRKNIFQRFQTFTHQEIPAVFLFFDEQILIALNNRFRGYRTGYRQGKDLVYRLTPVENWFVPRELQKY